MKNLYVKCSILLVVTICSFKAIPFESAGSNWYIASTYSGHEEITRQALNNVAAKIKSFDSSDKIFEISELITGSCERVTIRGNPFFEKAEETIS